MPLTTYKALKFNAFVQYLGNMYMAPVVDMVHLPFGIYHVIKFRPWWLNVKCIYIHSTNETCSMRLFISLPKHIQGRQYRKHYLWNELCYVIAGYWLLLEGWNWEAVGSTLELITKSSNLTWQILSTWHQIHWVPSWFHSLEKKKIKILIWISRYYCKNAYNIECNWCNM